MAEIGKVNRLTVLRKSSKGLYLDAYNQGEILLSSVEAPEDCHPGDELEVFICYDNHSKLIATTRKPKAVVDQFAFLKVVKVTLNGAFLDWGLQKDLFSPLSEQRKRMEEGKSYLVRIYLDKKTGRAVASTKLDKFLNTEPVPYKEGDPVDLIISGISDLGYTAIINSLHTGILYRNEVFQPLNIGMCCRGYIKKLREDGKIDLLLEKPGYEKIGGLAGTILDTVVKNGGRLDITDKSDPELIYKTFGTSKKNFKKAVGQLYKEQKIIITDSSLLLPK